MDILNFIVDYTLHFLVFFLKIVLFLGAYFVILGLIGHYFVPEKK